MPSSDFSESSSNDDWFVIAVVSVISIVAIASVSAYFYLTDCPQTISLLGPQGQPVKTYRTTRHSIKIVDFFSTQLSFWDVTKGEQVHLRNVSSYAVSGCLPTRE